MKWFLRKITGIAIANFVFLLFAAIFLLAQKTQIAQKVSPVNIAQTDIPITSSTPTPTIDLFAELGSHNTKSDCWMSYKGNIYDISPFFGTHPGGDGVMLAYCGSDATVAFDATPHSANARSLLAQYLVQ